MVQLEAMTKEKAMMIEQHQWEVKLLKVRLWACLGGLTSLNSLKHSPTPEFSLSLDCVRVRWTRVVKMQTMIRERVDQT